LHLFCSRIAIFCGLRDHPKLRASEEQQRGMEGALMLRERHRSRGKPRRQLDARKSFLFGFLVGLGRSPVRLCGAGLGGSNSLT